MTPRQGQPKAAQLEAAFERIGAALDEIVEREQQKGERDDKQIQRAEDRDRRDHV
jgi:hypothetical protein